MSLSSIRLTLLILFGGKLKTQYNISFILSLYFVELCGSVLSFHLVYVRASVYKLSPSLFLLLILRLESAWVIPAVTWISFNSNFTWFGIISLNLFFSVSEAFLQPTTKMSLQNVGYRDEEEFGENFQLQDHSGNGSMDHDLVITRVNQDAGSLFRSEEMALCQLFLQVSYFLETSKWVQLKVKARGPVACVISKFSTKSKKCLNLCFIVSK